MTQRKCWIIYWDHSQSQRGIVPEKDIISFMSARLGEERIKNLITNFYISYTASLSEKYRYLCGESPPYTAQVENGVIHCGHNPFIKAEIVEGLRYDEKENCVTWSVNPQ